MKKKFNFNSWLAYFALPIFILLILVSIYFGIMHDNRINDASSPEKLTVRLCWFPDASASPIMIAKEKGFFADENLDVKIDSGGPEADSIKLLLSGSADISLANEDANFIVAKSEGAPMKAVAALWQNPNAVIVKKDSGIETPKDFEGKNIMLFTYTIEPGRVLDEMVKKSGGDPSKVNKIPLDVTYKSFLENKVDGTQLYLSDQLNTVKSQGADVKIFIGSDYGVKTYAGLVVVSDDTLKNRPKAIEKFLRALNKGRDYALNHKSEAAEIVIKYNPQYTEESLIGNLNDIEKYHIFPDNFRIDPSILKSTMDYLVAEKKIQNSFDVNSLYTNDLNK